MTDETESLRRQAETLLVQGDRTAAITAFRKLLAAAPDLPDAWYNLGYLLRREGRHAESLEAYGEALARGVDAPEEVHLNRAVILTDHLARHADAEAELLRALEIDPDYVPAQLNLGNLHEERGERDAAVACYQRILESSSDRHRDGRHEALARLTRIAPPAALDDPLLQQLHEACEGASHVAPEVRANLQFALGDSLDRLGSFDAAFEAYGRANRIAHRKAPRYDRSRTEAEVDALIAGSPPSTPMPAANDALAPIFICGMPRSGSTLIEQVLAGHPQVIAGGEMNLLPRSISRFAPGFPHSLARLDEDTVRRMRSEYEALLAQRFPDVDLRAVRITDKRPGNYILIGLIMRMFPEARIVHTTRAPLDNCLSIYFQHLDPYSQPHAGSLADIGHLYLQYRRLLAHYKTCFPGRIHDFPYEPFVREPAATLEPLLAFLGLDWHEDLLAFHHRGETVKTASYWQVRQPLYTTSAGRWEHYRRHLEPLMENLRGIEALT